MPLDLIAELEQLVEKLAQEGLDYAVCGGIAVTIHGATRSTKDIDVLVQREDLHRALQVARSLGFSHPALPMTFDAGTPQEREVQRVTKLAEEAVLTLDLVIVTPVLADVFESRQTYQWADKRISVVSLEGLAKMKRMAGRNQDLADLEKLGVEDTGE